VLLHGRCVWLIGASSGIGAALAPGLAAVGARLALSARRADELERVAESCRAAGGEAPLTLPLDVTEPGALARAAAAIAAHGGPVEVLIYSAGAWDPTEVTAFDAAQVEQQIAVNYLGLARAVEAVLPPMLERGRGEIVGVASLAGLRGFPRAAGYTASKAASITFLESLRLDLGQRGIGVTTVLPGFVETQLTARNDFPMPFMMKPPDAARAILRGLARGDAEIAFPQRLAWPLRLLHVLPPSLYHALASRMPRRERTP
jgi:short-subunit dehydrogenase